MAQQKNPKFKYEVRSKKTGEFKDGTLRAVDKRAAEAYLHSIGYTPISVEIETALSKDLSFGKKRVKLKSIAQFMRQFSTLVKSGIPVTRTLDVLRDQELNPTLKETIIAIRKDIDTGSTLWKAFDKHPLIFSPIVINMLRAGETGGFLNETLDSIATTLEKDVALRAKIRSAMTYPVAVLILAALLTGAMLLFIVPVFKDMFEGLGGQLPVATQILVSISDFLQVGAIPVVIGIAAFIYWWNKNKHKESIRRFLDPIKLKLPIFGKLSQKITIARFSRNFASLLKAGLPILQVMDIVGPTSGSTVLEDALAEAKTAISQGEPIAPQLAKHKIFPRMLTEMLAIGEDAGEIPSMMERVADNYDEEVNTTTDQLSSLLEPIMLVLLGAVVGGIIVGLYLPIFSIYELVQ